jgi:uncharacterized LabA/DUF88 family protein
MSSFWRKRLILLFFFLLLIAPQACSKKDVKTSDEDLVRIKEIYSTIDRIREKYEDKYGITKAFLFIGYIATNQGLYTALQKDGYIIIFKPTLILPNGKAKGNVDAEMVLHSMIEFPKYEKALIVTGDGDFYCLIDYLKSKNKLLKLMIPNMERYSSLFRKFMHEIVFMNNLKDKLEY